LAEWLFEEGIGEDRAILVEDGEILEAAIELPGPVRAGAVMPARLARILIPGRRGIAALDAGGEALVEPLPADLTEGAAFRVEIVREPVPEAGKAKLAKGRATDAELRPGAREAGVARRRPTLADAALYGNLAMLEEADPALLHSLSPGLAAYKLRLEAARGSAEGLSRQALSSHVLRRPAGIGS